MRVLFTGTRNNRECSPLCGLGISSGCLLRTSWEDSPAGPRVYRHAPSIESTGVATWVQMVNGTEDRKIPVRVHANAAPLAPRPSQQMFAGFRSAVK